MRIINSDVVNSVRLYGTITTEPKIAKSGNSTFATFSLLAEGRSADYHEITAYEHTPMYSLKGELAKGEQVEVKGYITYQTRTIKDDKGKIIAKIKEARIIAKSIYIGE